MLGYHYYYILFTMVFASFRCCFFGLVPLTSCCEEPFDYVRLSSSWTRSSSLRDLRQDDHTLKSLLSLLASCSLYGYTAIPTTCYIMPPILPCQASNPPFLANRCLAMLPLCSAPLIALLVAGEDEVCSMLEHGYVGISQYLLFN